MEVLADSGFMLQGGLLKAGFVLILGAFNGEPIDTRISTTAILKNQLSFVIQRLLDCIAGVLEFLAALVKRNGDHGGEKVVFIPNSVKQEKEELQDFSCPQSWQSIGGKNQTFRLLDSGPLETRIRP